ncbi:1241_t:CDS:10 [Ambispora leptoticha]|uniref:1241_t:CDS:1 n=1 Tax=Ambispora leptoticha TaxID=144679 RepID=A0A9N8WMW4_9GLOM|nr:1241_t:CDS:10 [Ambispora leptoticha]
MNELCIVCASTWGASEPSQTHSQSLNSPGNYTLQTTTTPNPMGQQQHVNDNQYMSGAAQASISGNTMTTMPVSVKISDVNGGTNSSPGDSKGGGGQTRSMNGAPMFFPAGNYLNIFHRIDILDVNVELIRVCIDYGTKGWMNAQEMNAYKMRLQSNLSYLATVADQYTNPQGEIKQKMMPDFSPLPPHRLHYHQKINHLIQRASQIFAASYHNHAQPLLGRSAAAAAAVTTSAMNNKALASSNINVSDLNSSSIRPYKLASSNGIIGGMLTNQQFQQSQQQQPHPHQNNQIQASQQFQQVQQAYLKQQQLQLQAQNRQSLQQQGAQMSTQQQPQQKKGTPRLHPQSLQKAHQSPQLQQQHVNTPQSTHQTQQMHQSPQQTAQSSQQQTQQQQQQQQQLLTASQQQQIIPSLYIIGNGTTGGSSGGITTQQLQQMQHLGYGGYPGTNGTVMTAGNGYLNPYNMIRYTNGNNGLVGGNGIIQTNGLPTNGMQAMVNNCWECAKLNVEICPYDLQEGQTTGSQKIDDFIRDHQAEYAGPGECHLQWINYDEFEDIKQIGRADSTTPISQSQFLQLQQLQNPYQQLQQPQIDTATTIENKVHHHYHDTNSINNLQEYEYEYEEEYFDVEDNLSCASSSTAIESTSPPPTNNFHQYDHQQSAAYHRQNRRAKVKRNANESKNAAVSSVRPVGMRKLTLIPGFVEDEVDQKNYNYLFEDKKEFYIVSPTISSASLEDGSIDKNYLSSYCQPQLQPQSQHLDDVFRINDNQSLGYIASTSIIRPPGGDHYNNQLFNFASSSELEVDSKLQRIPCHENTVGRGSSPMTTSPIFSSTTSESWMSNKNTNNSNDEYAFLDQLHIHQQYNNNSIAMTPAGKQSTYDYYIRHENTYETNNFGRRGDFEDENDDENSQSFLSPLLPIEAVAWSSIDQNLEHLLEREEKEFVIDFKQKQESHNIVPQYELNTLKNNNEKIEDNNSESHQEGPDDYNRPDNHVDSNNTSIEETTAAMTGIRYRDQPEDNGNRNGDETTMGQNNSFTKERTETQNSSYLEVYILLHSDNDRSLGGLSSI